MKKLMAVLLALSLSACHRVQAPEMGVAMLYCKLHGLTARVERSWYGSETTACVSDCAP